MLELNAEERLDRDPLAVRLALVGRLPMSRDIVSAALAHPKAIKVCRRRRWHTAALVSVALVVAIAVAATTPVGGRVGDLLVHGPGPERCRPGQRLGGRWHHGLGGHARPGSRGRQER